MRFRQFYLVWVQIFYGCMKVYPYKILSQHNMSPIYGTHNSCTYGSLLNSCSCVVLPWVRNQSLTITEQLEKGIRWLDFRVSFSKGNVYLSHTYLMEHTFTSVMEEIANHLTQHPDSPFLFLHLRVDFNDRANQADIQPIVQDILSSYSSVCIQKDAFDATTPLLENKTTGKVLFYCADGTLSHPSLFASDLMPTLYGWDAGSIDALEERLLNMDAFFEKQTQSFLYPKERMINFDYSSTAPLWYTDRQQIQLMKKHGSLMSNVTILAGNHVEDWLDLFQ